MMNGEPLDEPIFQVIERLLEHDRVRRAVPIHQSKTAAALPCETGFHEAQNRRDPRTCREGEIMLVRTSGLANLDAEAALRRQDVDGIAGLERLECAARKKT